MMSASLSRANELTASTVTLPILRDGTETMREKLSASRGLKQKRMYATRSLTSRRSQKRIPPTRRYGIRRRASTSSKARDWALVRYSAAKSE